MWGKSGLTMFTESLCRVKIYTVLPRIHGHAHIYVTEIPRHANKANQKLLFFWVGKSVDIYVTLACQSKKTENRTKGKGSF